MLDLIVDLPHLPDAACADVGDEIFFPGLGRSDLTARAKSICARCPERAACLDYALRHPQLGIWGGHTEAERARMKTYRKKESA